MAKSVAGSETNGRLPRERVLGDALVHDAEVEAAAPEAVRDAYPTLISCNHYVPGIGHFRSYSSAYVVSSTWTLSASARSRATSYWLSTGGKVSFVPSSNVTSYVGRQDGSCTLNRFR